MTVTVNLHEAKTHLSRLVDQAARGREFVIAKAGRPMVRVVPIDAPPRLRVLDAGLDLREPGQLMGARYRAGGAGATLTSAPAGSPRPAGSPHR